MLATARIGLPPAVPFPRCSATRNVPEQAPPAEIVIVGAGIAGLAAALAFRRLGVETLVLEKGSSLRAGGTSLSIWKNAWKALDVLGVGSSLREQYLLLSGSDVISAEGKLVHHMKFGQDDEVRAVERQVLLEALAQALPPQTIRFDSKVVNIRRSGERKCTEVELEDGAVINSKILVGCDGLRSEVARFMGVSHPGFVGQCAIRGVAHLEQGHNYGQTLVQLLGRGTRAGIVPLTTKKVYWFVAFKSSSEERRVGPESLRQEAMDHFKSCCESRMDEFSLLLQNSPNDSLTRSSLRDRWSFLPPGLAADGVTLAGDALHPMTPNLGQGGCLALEDAVVLAREVHKALKTSSSSDSEQLIGKALDAYARERWLRFLPLTIKSHAIGFAAMLDFWPVVYVRDTVGVKLALQPDRFLSHTRYDCGNLL